MDQRDLEFLQRYDRQHGIEDEVDAWRRKRMQRSEEHRRAEAQDARRRELEQLHSAAAQHDAELADAVAEAQSRAREMHQTPTKYLTRVVQPMREKNDG